MEEKGDSRHLLTLQSGSRQGVRLDPVAWVWLVCLLIGLALVGGTLWMLTRRARETDSGEWMRIQLAVALQTRDAQQIEMLSLKERLAQVEQQSEVLAAQATRAAHRGDELEPPPLALIWDVPQFKQEHPLSCESSAAAMAAHFGGVLVSEADILAAIPRHANPHRGFRGNVDGAWGGLEDYGVYAEPVRQVLAGLGLQVQSLVGGVAEIREQIRQGSVVLAWVTFDMQEQTPQQVTLDDGQTVTLVPFQHVVLVVGYNAEGLWVNDPYSGTARFYRKDDFTRSFAYLGNMALVVSR